MDDSMSSKVIRFLYNTSQKHQGAVVTIGNFDGVHVGHQQLIAKTVEKARALGVPSIAITFEPHTHEYFATKPIARLTRFREKVTGLLNCGIDYVLILKFNQELANLSASDFLTKLYEAIHPQHVIVGDDFRFGKGRQGDIHTLKEMGEKLGFSVASLAPVKLDEERVSSTRVRQA
jgi:riboflavin kinase/FMN adenylyltransferase